MAVIGGVAGAALVLTVGEGDTSNPLLLAAAYVAGGLIAMGVFVMTTTLRNDI